MTGRRGDEGFTYVVEFSEGTVKVGYSTRPTVRIKQHAASAAAFGISIARTWISGPHREAKANEVSAIEWCNARAKDVRRAEWFTGIAFTEVRTYLASLPMSRISDSDHEQREAEIKSRGRRLTTTLFGPSPRLKLTGDLDAGDAEHVATIARLAEISTDCARWVLTTEATWAVLCEFLQRAADAYAVKDRPREAGVISEWEWLTSPQCDGKFQALLQPLHDAAESAGRELVEVDWMDTCSIGGA